MKRLWILRLRSLVPAAQARAGLVFALLLLGLTACGTVSTPEAESETPNLMPTTASLPDLGPAPELTNEVWLYVDFWLNQLQERNSLVEGMA